jgi:hypothetical protein
VTKFVPELYWIHVSNPETGDSSSYADTDLGACFQWALNWAGVDFKITADGRRDD